MNDHDNDLPSKCLQSYFFLVELSIVSSYKLSLKLGIVSNLHFRILLPKDKHIVKKTLQNNDALRDLCEYIAVNEEHFTELANQIL